MNESSTESPEEGEFHEPSVPALEAGTVLDGRYRLERTLGAGGMGHVYEATHLLIERRVALKCLHPEFARDPHVVERFKREAKAATSIGHDHIVNVMDMGDLPDGAPYIVMEMLAGEALADRIERGPMQLGVVCKIARQIADALEATHEAGIVHRDLKPDNVFLVARRDDAIFVKVLDFGISKMHDDGTAASLTRTGTAIGTPSYMSPEQAQGLRSLDHRTDIYALGIILYEMLTNEMPFTAETYPMLLMQIVGGTPVPVSAYRPDLPPEFAELVMRCMAKRAHDRPPRMRDVERALAAWQDDDRPVHFVTPDDAAIAEATARRSARPTAIGKRAPVPEGDGNRTGALVGSLPPPHPQEGASGATPGTVELSTSSAEADALSPALPRRALIAGAVAGTLGLLAVGAWVFAGAPPGETVEVPPPERTTVEAPPLPVVESTPTPPASVEAQPAEVRVRIRATPSDAHIFLDDVEFPNPLDALQPRTLAPRQLRVQSDGFRTIERPLVLDDNISLELALAEEPSVGSGRRPAGTGSSTPSETAMTRDTPPEPPSGGADGVYRGREGTFRDDF